MTKAWTYFQPWGTEGTKPYPMRFEIRMPSVICGWMDGVV